MALIKKSDKEDREAGGPYEDDVQEPVQRSYGCGKMFVGFSSKAAKPFGFEERQERCGEHD
jgi:hypothetical protein